MLEQIAAYLKNIGYTVEEQGRIEKYLVVFRAGRPVGFILSDLSVKLVTDAEGQEALKKMIEFVRVNQNNQSVGKGEYVQLNYCGHRLTAFFSQKAMSVQYAAYIRDDETGEVHSTIYSSRDEAFYKFITQTQMIDLNRLIPAKKSFRERIRSRLIRYLLSKSDKAEQSKAVPPYLSKGDD